MYVEVPVGRRVPPNYIPTFCGEVWGRVLLIVIVKVEVSRETQTDSGSLTDIVTG